MQECVQKMASKKMLPDTVTLYNYIGESDMIAQYSITVLTNVFCDTGYGASATQQGKAPQDTARLFIFDGKVRAESIGGAKKQFLPFDEWEKSNSKKDFWTLNESEKDFFVEGISEYPTPQENHKTAYAISKAHYYKKGTSRMWHWEIDGL